MAINGSKVHISGEFSRVIFEVTPGSLTESRTANYDPWSLVHLPTDLYAYRNTSSRTWAISAMIVSRTPQEAEANSKILNTVRSWVLPDFARTGAPPEILTFSAYDDPNIDHVTCILQSYSWNYPADVDYVYLTKHKMPIISTLSLNLMEIWSAAKIQDQSRPWGMKDTGYNQITNPAGFGKMDPNAIIPSQPLINQSNFSVPNPSNLINNNFSFNNITNLIQDPLSGLTNSLPPLNIIPPGFTRGG